MVDRRYTAEELDVLNRLAECPLQLMDGFERLIKDGLVRETRWDYEITDAGRRVIGEA